MEKLGYALMNITRSIELAKALYDVTQRSGDMLQRVRTYRQRGSYRYAIVEQQGTLYGLVQDWLSAQLDVDALHDVRVGSSHNPTRLLLQVDAGIGRVQLRDGDDVHQVDVSMDDEDAAVGDALSNLIARSSSQSRLLLTVHTVAARDALLALFERLLADQSKLGAGLWLPNAWGEWSRRRALPHRVLSSVQYPDDEGQLLLDDLKKFGGDEAKYDEIGIPWHRGYLLHGPAGTGKTSTVQMLAYETGRDLYYAPVGDVTGDTSLAELCGQVPAGALLLLEDIDVFGAATERQQATGKQVTMAGLLNVLDGVLTPHGLVVVLTTNWYDRLDPALRRAGRVDVEVALRPNPAVVERLWARVWNEPFDGDGSVWTAAQVAKACVAADTPDAARQTLERMRTVDEANAPQTEDEAPT